ncbi:phage/plasmid primase, P4 family (plasmid) [Streptomyces scopuliridis]|uniref:Phage/plasmid primase, P4 family n=1 Tax=Streptomyces scopuliridis TaxID=452529 RepID=A0ACD4ZYR3_9ACTN|nr:phage/plasmid primase, P4 family [Streptomyces scopuliridis]WSB39233.1 phage/plasmid primase, P4 family [Streptomyces scopuliridis]WSC03466.1 phage/plasmid primase, P4 family [Streptomyces scopuliridis]WSC11389.1 phage/plasmid primase, P4 family [Streptomyces scopuliridis]
MSSADSPRFDAAAAAQQMLDFEALPGSGRFPVQHPVPPRPAGDSGLLPGMLTDRGNAKLFADLYSGRFRHVEGLGWYTWDSYRWKRVGGEKAALWAAGDMAEQMPVTDPQGVFNDREIASHRRRTMSTPGMKALLHQAKAAPALSLDPDVLDGAAYELCTPKGVIDLHSGRLRLPDPGRDLHSRATTVPAEAAPTPRWDRFLSATFGDDAKGREMIDFLHLLLGYSITGDVGAQVLPFLWGTGANGKSVLMDVMIQILGDYADAAPPGFLMDKGAFGEHSTELTELHGRRIFVCSELKPNDKFDEARVKLLTGGDKIKARRMRQDYFSFTPTHKLWLLGNHRPEVGTGGHAFWRRIRLIPFEKKVSAQSKIDNLAAELVREEGPGILHWLVTGARRYLATRDPLTGPDSVRLATAAYETTEDHIGRFLAECCTRSASDASDLRVEQGLLYTAYSAWCSSEVGVRAGTPRAFAARIRQEVGLSSPADMMKSSGKKFYPGIALLADDTSRGQRA